VPHKWSYNQQGDLIIAKNPYVKKRVVELPNELLQALESSFFGIRESAVTELGKYLRSRDSEMVSLAVAALERMKEDDSRRISSLAERLLAEFEQARAPAIKVTPSKPAVEIEPETATVTSDSLIPSPKMTTEIESLSGSRAAHPHVEKVNLHTDSPSTSQGFVFDQSFWFKWIGTTILGIVISIILYNYSLGHISSFLIIQFGILAGLISFMQWWVFRNRLESWWIAANTAAGAFLGGLLLYRKDYHGWSVEDLAKLLAFWVIGNFVLGPILMRKTQGKPTDFSASVTIGSQAELMETGARQNIFAILLPIYLVLYAFVAFIVMRSYAFSELLVNASWILYGFVSVLAGASFIRTKDVSRNFGFVALAIFLLLNGIIVELLFALNPDAALYFFLVPGMMALLSGMFFISQRDTWKNFRYIMLSGYLIFVSLVYFGVDEYYGSNTFSIITAIFAVLAAVFFFLRK